MAIIGFPYNSQDRDRAINAETYRRLLSKYFTTGVFPNPSTQFQVYATTGMNLTVKAGSANINGVYVEMESDDTVTIETASSQPRIDIVVLKHDDSTEVRATTLVVKKGTPSSNPQAPALERTETIYEIALANVYVGANTTSIAQSNITDVRLDSRLCGIVSATIKSIDTTTFFEQMTDDFNTWFEGVKDTLGTDTAGNLLNLINEIKRDYVPKSDIVNDLTTGGTNKPLSAEQGKTINLTLNNGYYNKSYPDIWCASSNEVFGDSIEITKSGYYLIQMSASCGTTSRQGFIELGLKRNEERYSLDKKDLTGISPELNGSILFELKKGDVINHRVYHTSGYNEQIKYRIIRMIMLREVSE